MNSLEYIVRKSIARFGVVAPRYYLRTATEENILLKEAETIIGKMAWRDLENVEELITEYWRIRQLDTEQIKLEEDMEKAKVDLEKAKQAAAHPETVHSTQLAEVLERMESERDQLTDKLHNLQALIHKAESVRKKFNGLKLKLTVLKAESAPAATLDAIRGDLQSVKNEYGELARGVENIRQEVKLFEEKIAGHEAEEANLRSRISHRELSPHAGGFRHQPPTYRDFLAPRHYRG